MIQAQDSNKSKNGQKATITNVDAKNHTVTVKMKDKSGKEVDRTFSLTGDVRYMDSTGKVAAIDFFRSGDYVLVVEEEGQLKEIHKSSATENKNQGQVNENQKSSATENKNQGQAEAFVQEADEIDRAEIKLGKLAQEKANAAAIKKFAERMVKDHSEMNKELQQIIGKHGTALSEKQNQKHQELCDHLSKMKGTEFDRAFAKDMVSDHQQAISKFEAESKNGQNPEIKAWAQKWLPTLREHLQLAEAAEKDVKNEH